MFSSWEFDRGLVRKEQGRMFRGIYTRREGRLKATWYKEGIPVSVGPLVTVRGRVRCRGRERRNLCSDVTVVTTHLLTRVSVSSRAPSGSSGSPRGRVVCVHQQPYSTERGPTPIRSPGFPAGCRRSCRFPSRHTVELRSPVASCVFQACAQLSQVMLVTSA